MYARSSFKLFKTVLILAIFRLCDGFHSDAFPKSFLIGAGTSAYQVEGAWNKDGKGPSIWDKYSHETLQFNADDSCKSYEFYKKDVEMLVDLGVTAYKFSISWSRILPNGTLSVVNEFGIDYYHSLIDALIKSGIQPIVTLYCFDLPQVLQDTVYGWEDERIIDLFSNYAKLCFERFGKKVKKWITINEPWVIANMGYEKSDKQKPMRMPPAVDGLGDDVYMVGHNILRAHAEAYRTYKSLNLGGEIGIALNCMWYEPTDQNNQRDIEAQKRILTFELGWFANPILLGDYPKLMRDRVEYRLPQFSAKEVQNIKGSVDFLGINYYTTRYASDGQVPDSVDPKPGPSYLNDVGVDVDFNDTWIGDDWVKEVPWGLRKLLGYVREKYGNIPVLVSENGVPDRTGTLEDQFRIDYMKNHLKEVLKAIHDGCNVTGYMFWSLMDNFEWSLGYGIKHGLYHVDFDDEKRPRKPKSSAKWLKDFLDKVTVTEKSKYTKGGVGDCRTAPYIMALTVMGIVIAQFL